MNYNKIYDSLIEKCKLRGNDKKKLDYYTEAHHIIPKSMGGSNSKDNLVLLTAREHLVAHKLLWYNNKNNYKMQRALRALTKGQKNGLTSRQFEVLRMQTVENNKGSGNPFFGKHHTEEAKAKTGLASKNRKQSKESIERTRQANLGAKRSEIGRINMSIAAQAKNLKPWQTSQVMCKPLSLSVWAMADHYYDFWKFMGCPGARRFVSNYNKAFNDSLTWPLFARMLKLFKLGFVPELDAEWVSFKHKYFKME